MTKWHVCICLTYKAPVGCYASKVFRFHKGL